MPGGFTRRAPTSPEWNTRGPTRSCMNKRYVTTHIEWCLNDLKCVTKRIMAMSHCRTAQFTLKLAVSADLCPKRSVPPLKPQLRTYRRHSSEENDGKKHIGTDLAFEAQVGE